MKLPNFLIHTFAAVGVISLIFWSCAAADSDNIDNIDNPPQLTGGTYQVERVDNSYATIVVLNTETGVMKSYLIQTIGGIPQWAENPNGYLPETTFTH
ncbi:hypothetical protein N9H59_03705 [Flavobacteriaceae bacterium]|nr:hypothetical protein [Flavobacteriaceae bacterium]